MHYLTIVPRDAADSVALRDAVRGTMRMARKLGLMSDEDYEEMANHTVEQLSPDHLSSLSKVAARVSELLAKASVARRRPSGLIIRRK